MGPYPDKSHPGERQEAQDADDVLLGLAQMVAAREGKKTAEAATPGSWDRTFADISALPENNMRRRVVKSASYMPDDPKWYLVCEHCNREITKDGQCRYCEKGEE